MKSLSPGGSITPIISCLITPITEWLHFGDHQVARLRRSQGGSISAILKWLYSTDHQHLITPDICICSKR
jgi:hypothetical protein